MSSLARSKYDYALVYSYYFRSTRWFSCQLAVCQLFSGAIIGGSADNAPARRAGEPTAGLNCARKFSRRGDPGEAYTSPPGQLYPEALLSLSSRTIDLPAICRVHLLVYPHIKKEGFDDASTFWGGVLLVGMSLNVQPQPSIDRWLW